MGTLARESGGYAGMILEIHSTVSKHQKVSEALLPVRPMGFGSCLKGH